MLVVSRPFIKTRRLGKGTGEEQIESVFNILRGQELFIVKLDAVMERECEDGTIGRASDIGSEFTNVVELLILLDE